MISFPRGFFWGAATSSYQVEGNNRWCDWWEWEMCDAKRDRSGDACRHYSLYESDFDIAQQLHHNCHRISIEWSRIERALLIGDCLFNRARPDANRHPLAFYFAFMVRSKGRLGAQGEYQIFFAVC
jgi:beta-glucosidase/6-phospho-beta-glucosidase/beta-galactosidase